ncbi:MAG: ABC transporter permease [Telluria sp.]
MLRHIFKLVWKRKTRHLMLSLEILLAFVIVFAVAAIAVRFTQLYRLPTGMDYQDVWYVDMQRAGARIADDPDIYDQLRRTLRAQAEVAQVGFVSFSPFESSAMTGGVCQEQGPCVRPTNLLGMDNEFPQVLRLPLVEGRWFSSEDAPGSRPVVVNRAFAEAMFPGANALGKRIKMEERTPQYSVIVGIVDEFRPRGEFAPREPFVLKQYDAASPEDMRTMVLRMNPGVTRGYEARLTALLKQMRPGWSFTIGTLAERRASHLREELVPLTIVGIIAAFLLLMVAFGLFGVLWQNIARRVPEIGLRRAIGASPLQVYGQIVGEQLLLSSLGIAVALILLVQLPITGVLREALNWEVFIGAALLSALVIYLLSLLCALYPGWRASRLSPSEALHYE